METQEQNNKEFVNFLFDKFFTKEQLEIILDAVEDYGVLVDEDLADKCGEILNIIEAHLANN